MYLSFYWLQPAFQSSARYLSLSSGKGNQVFHFVSFWLDFITVIAIIAEFWILIFTLLHILRITVWKGNLPSNIPIGTGGIEHLPLTYCLHIFRVQNYLFLHLILTIQTRPVYSTARSHSSLSSASPFIIGYSPSTNPMASFDSNLIPSSSSPLYTESSVVKNLSVRLTAQSILPPQIDWYRPSGPQYSYMVPAQSNFMISTSSNPQSSIQRFFQEFRLPDYTLDSFSGRLLDVVSSTTFSSGDVQTELHHAIPR